jgi:hypothetical protein
MKGKEVNGNCNRKGKERKMEKDVIRKGKMVKKEIIKKDNNNNKVDYNGGNSNGKGNKRVNSFAIPKLNVEDFIMSKSDDDNFSDDNNYNYNNKDYGNVNNILYSLDNNNNHNNSNILSEFFTKNNT